MKVITGQALAIGQVPDYRTMQHAGQSLQDSNTAYYSIKGHFYSMPRYRGYIMHYSIGYPDSKIVYLGSGVTGVPIRLTHHR